MLAPRSVIQSMSVCTCVPCTNPLHPCTVADPRGQGLPLVPQERLGQTRSRSIFAEDCVFCQVVAPSVLAVAFQSSAGWHCIRWILGSTAIKVLFQAAATPAFQKGLPRVNTSSLAFIFLQYHSAGVFAEGLCGHQGSSGSVEQG